MLDIVMSASKPQYRLMAHRALKVTGQEAETHIHGSLPAAVSCTPLAGKVVLTLEGGKHQDFEASEAYLSTQNLPWQILLNDEVTTYQKAVVRGLMHCTAPMIAIVPVHQTIRDAMWVQRMSWCLQKDPKALLCTTWEAQGPAKDLAPHVATPRRWPGGEIILARRQEFTDIFALLDDAKLYENLATAAAAQSWRIWAHPGIRFDTHEEQEDRPKARPAAANSVG